MDNPQAFDHQLIEEMKNKESYDYECRELPTNALRMMNDLRKREQLCDVTLIIGNKKLYVHRLVLAATSQYFHRMFLSEMKESKADTITLKDVDEGAMETLIDFAYTSRLHITIANVQNLMAAASIFLFPTAVHACAMFLAGQLHTTNCLGIRTFAEDHSSQSLVKKAEEYFRDHFMDAVKSEEFLQLSAPTLGSLINSDDLHIRSEEAVYDAVMLWINHDEQTRSQHLPDLLCHVRLPHIAPSCLTTKIESNEFIRNNLKCRDLIDEAKNFHLMPDFSRLHLERFRPRKSTCGQLFAIGGRGAVGEPFRSVECYDFRNNEWTDGAEMISCRRHVGVSCLNGKLYAVGGHDGTQHLNTVECYDPLKRTWSLVASMKTLRRGIAVGVLGGPLYAVGGLDDVNCYRTVERYDPDSDEWTEVASLRTPRGGVGVATLGKFLYAAGGNDGSASLNTVERYDPHVDKWTEVTLMSKRRAGVGLAPLNGYLYAVGGFDDASPLNTVERYDPDTNEWSFVNHMHHPRGGVGLCTMGGYLFAVGGHDGKSYLNSAEMYYPEEDHWEMIASMKVCRAGAGVVVCPLPLVTMPGSL